WLLLGDRRTRAAGVSITLTLGPIQTAVQGLAGRSVEVPIDVTSTGIRRNRVTPATWTALARTGEYSISSLEGSLRLAIQCVVDNPADT
ncbi:MAG: hypothetical protein JWP75_2938, partial [Frondihabitans sp.]|nr:hypothetical protein [Frondihabitans sp.]